MQCWFQLHFCDDQAIYLLARLERRLMMFASGDMGRDSCRTCCEYAAFRLLFAGPYTSAMQKAAGEYQLGRTS